jgi:thioesterase domain-containing protein
LPQADGLIYPLFSDVLSGVVSGPKVFCLPPLSGSGLSYVDLVAPIGGVQWIGIDFCPQHDWFEQCVEAISQQAAGDIFLMGYSSGGNLAFEMTKRLELAGIEVSGLILLDSWRRIKAQHLSEQAIQEIIDWHHQSAEQTILSEMHDVASLTAYLGDISQRVNSGQVKANIHSIQAEHQDVEQGASQEYLTLDWQQSTLGHYQVHQGQGDHLSLFSKQAIDHNRRILEEVVTCGKV